MLQKSLSSRHKVESQTSSTILPQQDVDKTPPESEHTDLQVRPSTPRLTRATLQAARPSTIRPRGDLSTIRSSTPRSIRGDVQTVRSSTPRSIRGDMQTVRSSTPRSIRGDMQTVRSSTPRLTRADLQAVRSRSAHGEVRPHTPQSMQSEIEDVPSSYETYDDNSEHVEETLSPQDVHVSTTDLSIDDGQTMKKTSVWARNKLKLLCSLCMCLLLTMGGIVVFIVIKEGEHSVEETSLSTQPPSTNMWSNVSLLSGPEAQTGNLYVGESRLLDIKLVFYINSIMLVKKYIFQFGNLALFIKGYELGVDVGGLENALMYRTSFNRSQYHTVFIKVYGDGRRIEINRPDDLIMRLEEPLPFVILEEGITTLQLCSYTKECADVFVSEMNIASY